jgi:hypothetical protein
MPQSRSGGFEEHNFLTLPEIEPRTVQLIAKSLHRLCAVLYVLSTLLLTVARYYMMAFPFKIKIFVVAHFRNHQFSDSYFVEVKTKIMRRGRHVSHVRKSLSDN